MVYIPVFTVMGSTNCPGTAYSVCIRLSFRNSACVTLRRCAILSDVCLLAVQLMLSRCRGLAICRVRCGTTWRTLWYHAVQLSDLAVVDRVLGGRVMFSQKCIRHSILCTSSL